MSCFSKAFKSSLSLVDSLLISTFSRISNFLGLRESKYSLSTAAPRYCCPFPGSPQINIRGLWTLDDSNLLISSCFPNPPSRSFSVGSMNFASSKVDSFLVLGISLSNFSVSCVNGGCNKEVKWSGIGAEPLAKDLAEDGTILSMAFMKSLAETEIVEGSIFNLSFEE
ncbi:hypothetical protein WICPIJ_003486 [Wickerhamomyces pijperi]|uniref:Uncharacterized protein n=1 Tax=Wickerhamomyces pijperi TaxID=599730 RepID=A0A9P8Q7J6_WICPI|nr:hypothetical protein WICPIJ_003486 [Wickerhamomyces pijperi]